LPDTLTPNFQIVLYKDLEEIKQPYK
jgi:hypothetical protein